MNFCQCQETDGFSQMAFQIFPRIRFKPVYVDASDECNMVNFQLGTSGIGTTIPTRQWNLKVIENDAQNGLILTIFK